MNVKRADSDQKTQGITFLERAELLVKYEHFCQSYRDLSDDTLKGHKSYLNRFFDGIGFGTGPIYFERLNPNDIQKYLFGYMVQHSCDCVRGMTYSLRSFLKFCVHQGFVNEDVVASVPTVHRARLGKVPFYLSLPQIERVLETVDRRTSLGKRDYSLLQMLSTYGIRGIQLWRLKLEDLAWKSNQIHFPAAKRGNILPLPLIPVAGNSLVIYLQEARPKSNHREIFLTQRGNPFKGTRGLSRLVAKYLQRAQINVPDGIAQGCHLFRHSLASRLLDHDVPLKQIADLLGHRDLNSTFIYTKIDRRKLIEACLEWPEVTT